MNKCLTALAIAVAVAAASTAVTSSADAQERYAGYRHYSGFDGAYGYVYYPRGYYSGRTRSRFGTFTRSRQGQRSG
jgi:hypothetical protein